MRIKVLAVVCLSALPLAAQTPVFEHADRVINSSSPVLRKKIPFEIVAVPPFSLKTFADKLEAKLKDHATGYQFVVSFND